MTVAERYRAGRVRLAAQQAMCCDVLEQVDADAPTLCAGWTAFDVAAHLDALCRDPLVLVGAAVPAMARRRAERLRRRLGYAPLVRHLRVGSPRIAAFHVDPWQGWLHHLGEWFVHTEDVRRANGLPVAPPDSELDEALWCRVRAAARVLHKRDRDGLVLALPDGCREQVVPGPRPLVITGNARELMVHVYRGTAAEVTVSTSPAKPVWQGDGSG